MILSSNHLIKINALIDFKSLKINFKHPQMNYSVNCLPKHLMNSSHTIMDVFCFFVEERNVCPQGGTSISGDRGGLDLASSLEAKFGARFSQVHQIRGKIWGVLLLQDAKIGKESQF